MPRLAAIAAPHGDLQRRLRGVCARNGLFVCADNTHHCASMNRVFRAFLRPPQAAEEFFEAFLQTCFVSFTGIF